MTTALGGVRADAHVIGWVSTAHALSHFFQLTLPPLFPYIKTEFNTSYTVLGAMLSVFYGVSGLMQTIAGFAVDRFGPRRVLLAGLTAMSVGTALAALASAPWMLFVAAIVAGMGNSAFHPADLALLNARVSEPRLSYAFSLHNVGGNIGWICAPPFVVTLTALAGWRVALAAAAVIGVLFVLAFALQRGLRLDADVVKRHTASRSVPTAAPFEVGILWSRPVLMAFTFFALQAIAMVGFMTFSTTAFVALYDVPLVFATSLLTAFLVGGIAGTLVGGALAANTGRHVAIAVSCLALGALLAAVIASGAVSTGLLWPLAAGVGVVVGAANPSRDILVRGIAPPHARGRVYGFVYSGLDAGAGIAPLAFGWLLDHGMPAATFALGALALLLAIPTVLDLRAARTTNSPTAAIK